MAERDVSKGGCANDVNCSLVLTMRWYGKEKREKDVPSASNAAGLNEQSSNLSDTRPCSFAAPRLATMYSIDFLSNMF